MNENSRIVTIAHDVGGRVPEHARRVRQVNDFGNGDAARLALITAAVGEVARTFCWGGRDLEDAVRDLEAAANEWARDLSREAAR